MELHSPFQEITAILLIATVVGGIGLLLRQPLIISFIAVGLLVGPVGFGIVAESPTLELLAGMGIALLLFVVGLKLDLHHIRTTGPVAVATGIGQVTFTSLVGYGIGRLLGFGALEAVYIAVALTFSSTIIIVKLLSDKRELDELHGRIAVGFLIVQDIVVVLVMIVLAALGGAQQAETSISASILRVAGSGVAFLAVLGLVMKYVLPRLLPWIARSHELLVLFAIAWAVTLAAAGELLGFGEEVGAFLAGVSLASTGYREAIGARLVTLRDFLLLFFFIDLGVTLELREIGAQIFPAVVFSLFVLIGNPLIVLVIMGLMGYRARVSFLAGLTVAQISEFSLILAALGLSLGHLTSGTMGMITAVGLITIALSTYMILYSAQLYRLLEGPLAFFERQSPRGAETEDDGAQPQVIVFGVGRHGGAILNGLRRHDIRVMGVDYDPQAVASATPDVPLWYGDVEDPELPGVLPLASAAWVVSAVPGRDANLSLMHAVRHHGFRGKVMLTARDETDAEVVMTAGADEVIRPYAEAAARAVGVVSADCRAHRGRPWDEGVLAAEG